MKLDVNALMSDTGDVLSELWAVSAGLGHKPNSDCEVGGNKCSCTLHQCVGIHPLQQHPHLKGRCRRCEGPQPVLGNLRSARTLVMLLG